MNERTKNMIKRAQELDSGFTLAKLAQVMAIVFSKRPEVLDEALKVVAKANNTTTEAARLAFDANAPNAVATVMELVTSGIIATALTAKGHSMDEVETVLIG